MAGDEWLTVEQAAQVLGSSTSTVRRRMRDGSLVGEELTRPQGKTYLIRVPFADRKHPLTNEDEAQLEPPSDGAAQPAAPLAPGAASEPGGENGLVSLGLLDRLTEGHRRELQLAEQVGELRGRLTLTEARLRDAESGLLLERAGRELAEVRARGAEEQATVLAEALEQARAVHPPEAPEPALGGPGAARTGAGGQDTGGPDPGAPGRREGWWSRLLARLG